MALTKKQKYEMCEDVILHWWENLFLAYAGELTRADIDGIIVHSVRNFIAMMIKEKYALLKNTHNGKNASGLLGLISGML
jgi:hypothetical protein